MTTPMKRVCTLAELARDGHRVVPGEDRPIVVFHDGGDVVAVDNRCPHLGFPLSQGECRDGMITCPWHHARFDACSGSAFDLFAGDLTPFDAEVRDDGEVYVSTRPRPRDARAAARRVLDGGLELRNDLMLAKATLALRDAGVSTAEIAGAIGRFGATRRDSWSGGMTTLACAINLLAAIGDDVSDETANLALFQGARAVAADCFEQPPRRVRGPLELDGEPLPPARLTAWLDNWVRVRHRDGAERTVLAAARQLPPAGLADLVFGACTVRRYASTGHLVDFANKAFELVERTDVDRDDVLPTILDELVMSRGGEELDSWRNPVDLVPLAEAAAAELAEAFGTASGAWDDGPALAETLQRPDLDAALAALTAAARAGATAAQLGQALALAAAGRLARFGDANEHSDWIAALHTFSYANATHQALRRVGPGSAWPARAIADGAVRIFLDRFLVVPPAKRPEPGDDLPADADGLARALLDAMDNRHALERAALLVARWCDLALPLGPLIDVLARAVFREDADFHWVQGVEAAARQAAGWPAGSEARRTILVGCARLLAAHCPTQRAQLQVASVARKLHRGDALHEDAP